MEQCLGTTFILNNELVQKTGFGDYKGLKGLSVYEIVRVEEEVPLFLEDHMERFFHSLELEKLRIQENRSDLEKQLIKLIQSNSCTRGKIKIVANFDVYPAQEHYHLLIYFTEFTVPDNEQYKQGVVVITCKAVRKDPNAKVLDTVARRKADRKIEEHNVYEALLIDSDGFLTEGSRSNLFVVKDEKVITPPNDVVLQGIARKNVLAICEQYRISFDIRKIHSSELSEVQSVFITGTSPKVLPVRQVDDVAFDPDNKRVRFLMEKYDERLEGYIQQRKKSDFS